MYTQEEVIELLKKFSKDADKAVFIGITINTETCLNNWIEYNIIHPLKKTLLSNQSISPSLVLTDPTWNEDIRDGWADI